MRYTFITGLGRSGTKFVATLLNKSPNADVFHDFIGQREYWLSSWYLDRNIYAIPYLEKKKKNIMEFCENDIFVDVNSYLNNDIKSLKIVFNNPKLYHLVRDPRKVIASTFLRINESTISKIPKDEDSVKKWIDENKFYRICYNWSQTIKYLLNCDLEIVQLEKITTDYDYFYDKIIKPSNLKIDTHAWNKLRKHKINKTRNFGFRKIIARIKNESYMHEKIDFRNLGSKRQEIFDSLCKPLMHLIGYK